ncbi:MAG: YgcG family protein [Rhodothermales bacterium]|nr:YgcG family protein [Rhodothermales bacterium]
MKVAGFYLIVVLAILAVPCNEVVGQDVPTLTGRVVDLADILSNGTERTITGILKAHEDSTSNQIAVLTIPTLSGESIESYSLRVARTWGLGTAENNNGVLLVIAVNDREMRIEVGFGLEGDLTDSRASRIIRGDMRTYFQEGNFDGGVLTGVQQIVGVLDGTFDPPEPEGVGDVPFWFGLIFLAIPMMFMFIGMFTIGSGKWFLFVFLMPFFLISGTLLTGSFPGGLVVLGIYALVYIGSAFHPKVKAARNGKTVKFGPFSATGITSSSSGGGWSSSSGGSSFSGGGGSFGGGGASGGW